MRSWCKIIDSLSHLGYTQGQRNGRGLSVRLRLGSGDMVSGTYLAADVVAMSPIMCTDLPNYHSAGYVEPLALCLDLVELYNLDKVHWNS